MEELYQLLQHYHNTQRSTQRSGGDSGGSNLPENHVPPQINPQILEEFEKKLRLADEQAESLKQAVRSREEEIERTMQQKVALTSIFESDLLQMTDKIIQGANTYNQRSSTNGNGGVIVQDLVNLQKLIAVSFQALKSSMQGTQQQVSHNNSK